MCRIGNVHKLVRDFPRWYMWSEIPKPVDKAGECNVVTSQSAKFVQLYSVPDMALLSITLDAEGTEDPPSGVAPVRTRFKCLLTCKKRSYITV